MKYYVLCFTSFTLQVYAKSKNVFFVYESVLAVVKGYNKILDSLSEEERLLFKPLTTVSDLVPN